MECEDFEKIQKALDLFPTECLSCVLATTGSDGEVLSSYAPFIKTNEGFILFLSRTAPHYQNLIDHPQSSLMLIQDEQKAITIYFRKRVTYKVRAKMISTTKEILSLFKGRHGPMTDVLAKMDFSFFLLVPSSGMITLGQSQFYEFDANQKIIGFYGMKHGPQR